MATDTGGGGAPAGGTLVVDTGALRSLAAALDAVRALLPGGTPALDELPAAVGHPALAAAARDHVDGRRADLVGMDDELRSLAEGCRAVADGFESADGRLAAGVPAVGGAA
ncbi:hypothetical protein [Cellulomonas marina]|uniref:Excreted virulence factor EspC, type VII ESX diderm n=1 Tax=Cellulomonas marina TaxID=988821 RepID=A0A1I0XXN3_9CELL|nr:hypothetical protein [Cellulomonas marina]GIG28474.1 hypothetical protein Cma02nite_10740 [Cellulomonas marina]SFB05694.1 hypothetical protein SAMN05421867_10646 [Cellulomonas marina]